MEKLDNKYKYIFNDRKDLSVFKKIFGLDI